MSVNVYKPDGSKKIVVPDNQVSARLADGYIDETAWLALCDQQAQQARQAWLANPDTAQERFAMLRRARDVKISATDYLMTADYPIDEARKQQVIAYRQALRDIPAQAGAPWDGGGELTPWPQLPA